MGDVDYEAELRPGRSERKGGQGQPVSDDSGGYFCDTAPDGTVVGV